MRKSSVWIAVVTGVAVCALTACSASAPIPAKPAPPLPGDSIAYDQLPVRVNRNSPLQADCSGFTPALRAALQMAEAPHAFQSSCIGQIGALSLQVSKVTPDPVQHDEDPWWSAWNNKGLHSEAGHFRRFILLGRYYAVSGSQVTAGGPGCNLYVNTGSVAVLEFLLRNQDDKAEYDTLNTRQMAELGEKYCSQLRGIAEKTLDTIDPDGGSLASR